MCGSYGEVEEEQEEWREMMCRRERGGEDGEGERGGEDGGGARR